MRSSKGPKGKITLDQYVINVATELRKSRNLSQREVAEAIRVTGAFVGNVENIKNSAKYNIRHINLLALYFNVSPRYFFPDHGLI